MKNTDNIDIYNHFFNMIMLLEMQLSINYNTEKKWTMIRQIIIVQYAVMVKLII